MNELTSNLVYGGLIVGLTALVLVVVHVFARRGLQAVGSLERVREARRQQLVTLVQTAKWVADSLILVTALMMLLSTFGVDIAPLLASAGIAGLAVSLGLQNVIKDLVGGLLILVENQYAVGDCIQVGNASGQVEQITLRATYVRALNGDLYVVPNGEVRIVANRTKEWSRVLLDVGVAYEEDLDRALQVLEESVVAFAQEPAFKPDLLEAPQVLGPTSLGDWAVTVRLGVKTKPGRQWALGRELRKYILAACAREGITLPYPRQEVWLHPPEAGDARQEEGEQEPGLTRAGLPG
jgi:small-conductance mechanosensitive channel